MIGDSLKGILFLAVIGFALLGAVTVLPDSAWERIPPKLVPVRQFLAEKGIISEKYRNDVSKSEMVCSNGVCRLKNHEEDQKISRGFKSKSETCSDSIEKNHFAQNEMSDLPSPFPTDSSPITEKSVAETESLPEEFPAELESKPSSDTLPDLQFEAEVPHPNHGPSLGAMTIPNDVMASPSSFEKANPIDASASKNHLKSIGRYETEDFSDPDPAPDPLPINDFPPLDDFPSPEESLTASEALNPVSVSPINTSPNLTAHEAVARAVAQSEGPGAKASAFIKLNDILNRFDAELSAEDRTSLNRALDRLAFHVFYKPNSHILWREYSVAPNETLASIAQRHKITPEFLAVINSIHQKPDATLQTGQKLKVVEGPVTADVSLSKMELLLKFNGLYAGRFKMGYAERAGSVRGEFPIVRKIQNPDYNGPIEGGGNGRIVGGDPKNPLGPCWIELEGGLGLQGTNHPEYVGQKTAVLGGLIFSNKDISHLNILLANGSLVRIMD